MSTEITIQQDQIDINVDTTTIVIESPQGGYPLPSSVYSVFGRVGNVIAQDGDYNLTQLGDVTISNPLTGQALVYNGTTWVNNTETYVGTVTSVNMSVPTGLTISGNPITTAGTLALGLASGYSIPTTASQSTWDTAYSRSLTSAAVTGTTTKTLTLNEQGGGTITATWSDYDTAPVTSVFGRTGAVVAVSGDYTTLLVPENTNLYFTTARAQAAITGTAPISVVSGNVTISQSGTAANGYLSSTDWNTFNGKQNALTLTTTGNNGSATLVGATLNVPTYTLAGLGGISLTGLSATSPLLYDNTTGTFSIQVANGSQNGYLSSTDWTTFNGKQAALNGTGFVKISGTTISYDNSTYLTTISGITAGGELSGTYANPSLVNSAVTGKVLTGVNITGGTIQATDSILTAFGKVQNQINSLVGGSIYKGTWNASTNTPTLASGVGTTGWYYIVNVAGSTNLDGITNWNVGDWAIFDGTAWQQVDNTDAVVSVNGFTGAVSLTTSNINEGTNLYYTDARARGVLSAGTGISYNSSTGVITNSAPDQTVSLTGGTGISTSGAYPNFTITNTAPDQVVSLTGAGTTSISGTYPNFTITSNDQYTGTVTSVGITESSAALTITGSPVTTSGNINIGFAGNSTQYVAGDGSLVTFPTVVTQAQNLVTEVYNNSGATITKGTVVYINGGQGNLPTITKAQANTEVASNQTIGLVRADITNMNNGYVTVAGTLIDLDTNGFTDGTTLYLSPTTAGAYTSTKPTSPDHIVYIGVVVRAHPTQGVIEVKIQNTQELSESADVLITSPTGGQILQYNGTTSLWNNVAGTTSNIIEGTNLYYTDARARGAISLTTTGNNGASTYNSTTGVLNVPTYTLAGLGGINLTSLSATSPLSYNNTTGVFSIQQASGSQAGYLSSADWTTFNSKQGAITLTTTGTSGAATFSAGTLNIPQYQAALTNPVTGTGTTNTLPKFTATNAIANSNITDSGTLITLGSQTYVSTGGLGIGTSTMNNSLLRVVSNITGSVTVAAVVSGGSVQTDVTTSANYFQTSATVVASATVATVSHYTATQGTFNTGSTITNQYGFFVNASLTGATSNYAFFSNMGASTGRWSFYSQGTASNYFAGSLGLGTTTLTGYTLNIGKTITGAVTSYAVNQSGIVQSDVTTATYGYRNNLQTAAAAFTLPSYFHFAATQGTIGSTSAVTNQYGYFVDSTMIGATNNYGFYSNIASGTNRWNLYMNGTANNYMAGNLGIGTNSPFNKMTIRTGDGNNIDFYDTGSPFGAGIQVVNDNSTAYKTLDFNASKFSFLTGNLFLFNYANGTLSISSNQVVSSSDKNIKNDDGGIENALDKVLKLTPRYFYWKEESNIDTTERQLGFYAQDVKEALGEEVANNNSNGKWGIYDRGIIAMLTKAVQEQQAQIEELKQIVATK